MEVIKHDLRLEKRYASITPVGVMLLPTIILQMKETGGAAEHLFEVLD